MTDSAYLILYITFCCCSVYLCYCLSILIIVFLILVYIFQVFPSQNPVTPLENLYCKSSRNIVQLKIYACFCLSITIQRPITTIVGSVYTYRNQFLQFGAKYSQRRTSPPWPQLVSWAWRPPVSAGSRHRSRSTESTVLAGLLCPQRTTFT
jgi:hypothetical protein